MARFQRNIILLTLSIGACMLLALAVVSDPGESPACYGELELRACHLLPRNLDGHGFSVLGLGCTNINSLVVDVEVCTNTANGLRCVVFRFREDYKKVFDRYASSRPSIHTANYFQIKHDRKRIWKSRTPVEWPASVTSQCTFVESE